MAEVAKAVFLSYASQDAEAARRICETLRGAGVEVWFDADGGLEHGDEWDRKIRRQIKDCVLFIPVISANTQARHEGYFRIEWDLAAERARGIAAGVAFILPVVIDQTREPDALVPDRFRMVQWTKLPGGEVPDEVRGRFLKLWGQRTGADGIGQRSDDGGRTPAERSRPDVVPATGSGTPARRWIFGIAVAAIGAVLIAGWRFQQAPGRGVAKPAADPATAVRGDTPSSPANEKSLVVLPLENLSPDPENAFFTEGMHTEMIATLQRIPDLKVISRNSALSFKTAGLSVADFASKVGVTTVLTGSVRRSGDRVRLQLELRRAGDDTLLWAPAPYDRDAKDALAIQTEIAAEVARVLQVRRISGTAEGARLFSSNPQAYELYLKAKEMLYSPRGSEALYREGIRLLDEVIKADPTFWYAQSYQSALHAQLAEAGGLVEKERRAHAVAAKRLADEALRAAPSGLGGGALAYYYMLVDRDPARALPIAEEDLRAAPNDAEKHNLVAFSLRALGRAQEALVELRRGAEIDPLNPSSRLQELWTYVNLRVTEGWEQKLSRCRTDLPVLARRLDELDFQLRGELVRNPGELRASVRPLWLWRARRMEAAVEAADAALSDATTGDLDRFELLCRKSIALRRLGRTEAATAAGQQALDLAEKLRAAEFDQGEWREEIRFSRAFAAVERYDEALTLIRGVVRAASTKSDLSVRWEMERNLALILAQAGRTRECVALIKHLLEVPSRLTVPALRVDPGWDNVRDDPEFKALLADPKNSAPL